MGWVSNVSPFPNRLRRGMSGSYHDDHKSLDPVFFFDSSGSQGDNADTLTEAITAFCAGRKGELGGFFDAAVQSPDRAALLDDPAWAYLALNSGGDAVRAKASATLSRSNATEAICINDLAAHLAKSDSTPLAAKLLRLAEPKSGEARFTILANLAVLSTLDPNVPFGAADQSAALRALAATWANPNRADVQAPLGPETLFPHACRFFHALLRIGVEQSVSCEALAIILDAVDRQPAKNRDMGLEFLVVECLPVSRALHEVLNARPLKSKSASVLDALSRYCISGDADLDALLAMDQDAGGYLALTIHACGSEEKGDVSAEIRSYETIMDRFPDRHFTAARLAAAYYRNGDLGKANEEITGLMPTQKPYFDMMKTVADQNQELLLRAIENGEPERKPDEDNYQDDTWARRAWNGYDYSFNNFSRHQEIGVAINAFWVDALTDLLNAEPTVRSAINFGSFNGYFDKQLADRFQDVAFVGYDRYADGINLSREKYRAPNLSFLSEAGIDTVIGEARQSGGPGSAVVLSHIRTCTTLYPDGVADLYRRCAENEVDFILGVEGAGFSFHLQEFVPQDDPTRAPVVPLGIMVDHNYPALLDAAGYAIADRQIRPYPTPVELRYATGLLNVVVFLAKRIR